VVYFSYVYYQKEKKFMSEDATLQEQQVAPDFTLPAVGADKIAFEGNVHLSDLRGHNVVLYFYPKED
jgi:peroxiredoxin Q/BCP